MTDAHREYINSLLDDLFNRYVNAIAQARQNSRRSARHHRRRSLRRAKAKEAGLIDDVLVQGRRRETVQEVTWLQRNRSRSPQCEESDYRDVDAESLGLNKGEKIAVIYATGDIGSGNSENSPSGESVDWFRHARKSDERCGGRQDDQGDRVESR